MASGEKSVVHLTEDLSYAKSFLLLLLRLWLSVVWLRCVKVWLSELNVLAVHWASWVCGLFLIRFGQFSAVISSEVFVLFSLLLFSLCNCHMHMFGSVYFSFLYSFFFLSRRLLNLNWPVFKFTNPLFYQFKFVVTFLFQLLWLSTPEFLLSSFFTISTSLLAAPPPLYVS